MSKKLFSTALPTKAVAMTLAGVLIGGGIAAAYWTATGSGSGTAPVGTSAALTVTQNSTFTALVPGGAAQAIDFTLTNSSVTDASVTSVVVAVESTSAGAACLPANFTIVQPSKPSVATPVIVAGSSSESFTSGAGGEQASTGATLKMENTASNQDGCKNATVNLRYTVS